MNRKTVLVTLGSTVAAIWLGAGITYAARSAERPTLGASAPTTVATVPVVPVPATTTTTTAPAPVTTTTVTTTAPAPTTAASAAPVKVAATVAPVTTEQPATTAPPETVPATTTTAAVSPPSTGSLDYVAYPQEPPACSTGGSPTIMDDMKGNARLLPNPNTVWTFKSVVIDGQPAAPPTLQHAGNMTFYPISYTTGWKVMVSIKLVDGRDCLAGTLSGGVN